MEFTYISTVRDMKANGKMIYNMVRVRRLGLMAPFTKANTSQVKNTASEHTLGTTAHDMRENGSKIKLEDSAYIPG